MRVTREKNLFPYATEDDRFFFFFLLIPTALLFAVCEILKVISVYRGGNSFTA